MGRHQQYVVQLTDYERRKLRQLISENEVEGYKIKHAKILLKADVNGPGWTNKQISETLGCHRNTVGNIRQRMVEEGLEAALDRKEPERTIDDPDRELTAKLIALQRSRPPAGHRQWTPRLLAEKVVELEVVPDVSDEKVRQILKKAEQQDLPKKPKRRPAHTRKWQPRKRIKRSRDL